MAQADKFPRLFNLVMLLLDARKPVPLDEIARRIGGFPDSPGARRQAIERAKKELRDLGIPIGTFQIAGSEQYGYQIDRSEMIISDLHLSNDEASALAVASAMVSFGTGERNSALSKLGCVIQGQEATVANVPTQPALYDLFEAIGAGRAVEFSYRSKDRVVDVYGISFRWGGWYLIGREHQSNLVKTFLVNLIESNVTISTIPAVGKPVDFDLASQLPRNRWEIGEGDNQTAVVEFLSDIAPLVDYELRDQSGVETRPDGSARVSINIVEIKAFFDWLLTYFDKAVLVSPAHLVTEFKAYLEAILANEMTPDEKDRILSRAHEEERTSSARGEPISEDFSYVGEKYSPEGLRSAGAMYSMLAKILPWLARQKVTTVKQISKTFGIPRTQVVRLLEMAACCGLPPYTPDSLLEIIVEDDGTVTSYLDMDIITAPRRLNTLEVMVLATTAAVVAEVPGVDPDGHLKSALSKLKDSLSKFRLGLSEVDVDMEEPYFLETLRNAANEHRKVDISYFSFSSERISQRIVDPYLVFLESGKWYIRGYCHLTSEIRHFSVGRILSCDLTDEVFEVPESERQWILQGVSPNAFGGQGKRTLLAISRDAAWQVERLVASPRHIADVDQYAIFEFQVSTAIWLSRLLVRLGPSAQILSPMTFREVKAKAVNTLLALYL